MAWTIVNPSSGDVLGASDIDALQANFTALAQQQSGAPPLNVTSMNDTERGNWTPYLSSSHTAFTQTGSGAYNKIGDILFYSGFILTTAPATGSLTNPCVIRGLPDVPAVSWRDAVNFGRIDSINYPAGALNLQGYLLASQEYITLSWARDDTQGLIVTGTDFDDGVIRIGFSGHFNLT